ncbi:hypothetical protein ACWEEK_24035 [Micromonospora aurantiaca (nom. illeg.)]
MPRGPVGGATAALIEALALRGVRVSPYQIERWRASGDLPRPVRHGLGRGRGVVSEEPDEQTIQMAVVLARASRRGSRRAGTHAIERLGIGRPVNEHEVRAAFKAVLDDLARLTGADFGDTDEGWQARDVIAGRAAREAQPVGWQDLVAAIDGQEPRPRPPRGSQRTAVAGAMHAFSRGDEALADDLIEMFGLIGDLDEGQREEMRRIQRDAELRGEDPFGLVAEAISLRNLRWVATTASTDMLRRATQVVYMIGTYQSIVVMIGVLDIAGSRSDLGRLNRFDSKMVRTLQADPMWPQASTVILSPRPRPRMRQLVLTALGILIAGTLPAWEAYRDRLLELVHHEH